MQVFVAIHYHHDDELIGAGDSLDAALVLCQRLIQKRRIPAILLDPEPLEDGQWMVKVQNKDRRYFEITRLEVEGLASMIQYNQDVSSGTVLIESMGD